MARHKDIEWNLPDDSLETWEQAGITWEQAGIAVLMDIRDRLNVLRCSDFMSIPRTLRDIKVRLDRLPPRRRQPMVSAHERHRLAMRRVRAAKGE